MTQLVLPAAPIARRRPRIGGVVRYGAAATFAILGLSIASLGISFPIVAGLIASGRVVPPASEVAVFEAVAPFWGLIVVFGLLQIAGAAGMLERRRWGSVVALMAALALLSAVAVSQLGVAVAAISMNSAGRVVALLLGAVGTLLLGASVGSSSER